MTTVFSSAQRAAATYNADGVTYGRGLQLHLNISAVSGTPTLDVKVQLKDAISGNFVDVPSAAFAQKSGTGTDNLTIYPGLTAVTNRCLSNVVFGPWRVVAVVGGSATPKVTFSIAAVELM